MEFLIPSLLFLFVFNTSSTCATNATTGQSLPFKELDCNQCQQRCGEKARWTVFQRRRYGNVDFYRGWDDYVNGFGDRDGDFWLGLETLHQITKEGNMELKIKVTKSDGVNWISHYRNFRIGPGSDNYTLHVSGYSGNVPWDGFRYHNNQSFSTRDADHDTLSSGNCASDREGGWWYQNCGYSNLNGNFHKTGRKGIWWSIPSYSLRFTEMKFRKRS